MILQIPSLPATSLPLPWDELAAPFSMIWWPWQEAMTRRRGWRQWQDWQRRLRTDRRPQ
jgi:hypothetical protein